ncbi:MAG: RidA family protein [Planctomycetes bacterium]|nr:RidA family protein [Planctomycetota bacterium]
MSCCCSEKKIVRPENGPKAIGPYSLGVQAGHLVFTAGQIGIIPATGEIIEGGVEAETRQALENVKVILEAAGTSLANVVKTTVFLRDINDFNKMNAIYGPFFPENPPARSAIQVAALPRGATVEIESVALVPSDCDCDCDCNG